MVATINALFALVVGIFFRFWRIGQNAGSSNNNLDRPVARRHFFEKSGGFLGAAIGYLWASKGLIAAPLTGSKGDTEQTHIATRLPVRINSVILLFMCGGVSQVELGFGPIKKILT